VGLHHRVAGGGGAGIIGWVADVSAALPIEIEQRRRLRGEGVLLGLTLIWGTSFLVIKRAQDAVSPGTLVCLRFAIAAMVLSPFLRFDRRLWMAGVELGFWQWAGYLTQAIGLKYTTTGRSAFVTSLNVIFVPMLAIAAGRRIGAIVWIAAAGALLGAAMLCYDGSPANVGDLWTLAAAVTFAVLIVRLEGAAAMFPALPLTGVQLWTVCALSLPWFGFDLATRGMAAVPWGAVVYLGVACTAGTIWLQTVGQRDVPAPQASIIFMLEPVWVTVIAYVLRPQERLGWQGVAGSALILGATLLSQAPLFRRPGKAP
jgi:drug/metabolite transporter (DMT)-like permease